MGDLLETCELLTRFYVEFVAATVAADLAPQQLDEFKARYGALKDETERVIGYCVLGGYTDLKQAEERNNNNTNNNAK